MSVQPVSKIINARSPYKIVDLPPTKRSEVLGHSRALRTTVSEAGTILSTGITQKLYGLEPSGGMTEILQLNQHDKAARTNLDLRVIKGVGKIVKYSVKSNAVEIADLRAQHTRVIRNGDAYVVANTSSSEPLVVEFTEMPTLKIGELKFLGTTGLKPTEANQSIPDEFYDAVAQLMVGHY